MLRAAPGPGAEGPAIELLLVRSNPLYWPAVTVLFVSGGLTAGIGRRVLQANSGVLTGWKAVVVGAVYVGFGLAGGDGAFAARRGRMRGGRVTRWRGPGFE